MYISPMGPDCTEFLFLFLRTAATCRISFLLYQGGDIITRCHGGQGSPCSGPSWSGGWQWGWGTEGAPTLVSAQC